MEGVGPLNSENPLEHFIVQIPPPLPTLGISMLALQYICLGSIYELYIFDSV